MTMTGRVTVDQTARAFDRHAVIDGRIKDISLNADTSASHWLILIFFPKTWSFICPTEIRAFNARLEEFLYSRSAPLPSPAQTTSTASKPGTQHQRWKAGSKACMSLSSPTQITPLARALFIIDPKGTIHSITVSDANVGRSVDETQRVLDTLVFHDEFGEGSPVDWKKGDKGIDLATKSRVDGPIEVGGPPPTDLRKSWTDWARPKLTRAWSNTSLSQRSIGGVMSHSRIASADGATLPTLASFHSTATSSLRTSETASPAGGSPILRSTIRPASAGITGNYQALTSALSPMSAEPGRMELHLEEAMARQKYANLQAAILRRC